MRPEPKDIRSRGEFLKPLKPAAPGLDPKTIEVHPARGVLGIAGERPGDPPGVPKQKLSLEVDGERLIIEGELVIRMPEGMEATHAEVSLPRYRRLFTLCKELDPDKLQAELKLGVLMLRIQKTEHARPRRIEVRAG
jgi:HSP20 family molecular chaperone IbpA